MACNYKKKAVIVYDGLGITGRSTVLILVAVPSRGTPAWMRDRERIHVESDLGAADDLQTGSV